MIIIFKIMLSALVVCAVIIIRCAFDDDDKK